MFREAFGTNTITLKLSAMAISLDHFVNVSKSATAWEKTSGWRDYQRVKGET